MNKTIRFSINVGVEDMTMYKVLESYNKAGLIEPSFAGQYGSKYFYVYKGEAKYIDALEELLAWYFEKNKDMGEIGLGKETLHDTGSRI
ncbi:MAG: hypothetical protein DRJ03_19870 [Chloroflexi bacterium]|nr:MAG: hypothetical protein DRJ03_19870 [Chloroflexota bacterium]